MYQHVSKYLNRDVRTRVGQHFHLQRHAFADFRQLWCDCHCHRHQARQLWRFRLKSVALSELERHVLGVERGFDIPSHTIPARYFDFLRERLG